MSGLRAEFESPAAKEELKRLWGKWFELTYKDGLVHLCQAASHSSGFCLLVDVAEIQRLIQGSRLACTRDVVDAITDLCKYIKDSP